MINKFKTFTLTLILGVLLSTSTSQALILISEINSNGTGGDFFEVYNSGSTAVDFSGWRWADYDVRNWASASSFGTATLNPGEVAVVGAGSNGASPTPLFGSTEANTAFRTSWGLSTGVKMLTWSGTGAGLGSGDGVVLFNSSGNLATSLVYRMTPGVATQSDNSTVQLSTFVKSFGSQPTANGHAGLIGGGTATDSLVWDPTSGTSSPTYRNAVVGQWDAFANPNSSVTIGSPGAVPEPSSSALLGLGTIALLALRRLNRKA